MKPQLQSTLASLLNPEDDGLVKSTALVEAMIEKYSHGLPPPNTSQIQTQIQIQTNSQEANTTTTHEIVLLTGSTGRLGSYLLSSLLQNPSVSKVYALNRPSAQTSIQERQRAAFEDGGFGVVDLENKKLVFVETDASEVGLGLPCGLYDQIRTSVTLIIHNAWTIHFNLPLSSFEPHIRATRNLIDLALASPSSQKDVNNNNNNNKPRFMFMSSILSAFGWDRSRGCYPEEIQYDAKVGASNGYGGSKYVAERILAKSGLPACSFRIGQICGGAPRWGWSSTEWFAATVKSSLSLGVLPDYRGVVSWIPTQAVSNIVLDVAFAKGKGKQGSSPPPPPAINLVHPTPTPWGVIIKGINKVLVENKVTESILPVVPVSEWMEMIRIYAAKERTPTTTTMKLKAKEIPVIKISSMISAFAHMDEMVRKSGGTETGTGTEVEIEIGGWPMFGIGMARQASPTWWDLQPLTTLDVANWVKYWIQEGFILPSSSGRNEVVAGTGTGTGRIRPLDLMAAKL